MRRHRVALCAARGPGLPCFCAVGCGGSFLGVYVYVIYISVACAASLACVFFVLAGVREAGGMPSAFMFVCTLIQKKIRRRNQKIESLGNPWAADVMTSWQSCATPAVVCSEFLCGLRPVCCYGVGQSVITVWLAACCICSACFVLIAARAKVFCSSSDFAALNILRLACTKMCTCLFTRMCTWVHVNTNWPQRVSLIFCELAR